MEDYFRQEDAKNSVGNSILQKNTLPENQPPLRYPKVIISIFLTNLEIISV